MGVMADSSHFGMLLVAMLVLMAIQQFNPLPTTSNVTTTATINTTTLKGGNNHHRLLQFVNSFMVLLSRSDLQRGLQPLLPRCCNNKGLVIASSSSSTFFNVTRIYRNH